MSSLDSSMHDMTLEMDAVEELMLIGELIPVMSLDDNGEMIGTDKWIFTDTPDEKYSLKVNKDKDKVRFERVYDVD